MDTELIGAVLAVIRDLAHSADMTMLMATKDPDHERTEQFRCAVLAR